MAPPSAGTWATATSPPALLDPLETLLALPQPAQYLRDGLTLATLKRMAGRRGDAEAEQQMQHAKRQLFERFGRRL